MTDRIKTLQQKRAQKALDKVKEAEKAYLQDKEQRKVFLSCAKDFPATILINGLGQAVATLRAQTNNNQKDPHMAVYNALEEWLCRNEEEAPYPTYSGKPNLLDAIVQGDRDSYLHAQAEALAYLEWYKKFAVALLTIPETTSDNAKE